MPARYPQRPAFTCWNLLRALSFVQAQLKILGLLQLVGPCSRREIRAYLAPYLPGLSEHAFERMLLRMHKAQVIELHILSPCFDAQYWGLPGQSMYPRRRATRPSGAWTKRSVGERRSGQERRTAARIGSWWIAAAATREGFQAAAVQRFASEPVSRVIRSGAEEQPQDDEDE